MASTSKKRSSAAAGDIDNHDSSKRAKTNTAKNSASRSAASSKVDANGDRYWEISKARRATVSTFRGKKMVNIREYYEKDGQELPGKKVSPPALSLRHPARQLTIIDAGYLHATRPIRLPDHRPT